MRIRADRHIPWIREFFGSLGQLELFDPPDFGNLNGVDALLVRSTSLVNSQTLGQARPKLVATATAGTDHLDLDFLSQAKIPWVYAPGCNAQAVAEWVVAALAQQNSGLLGLEGKILGIVGLGAAGGALKRLASILGLKILASDPLKESAGDSGPWRPLETLLSESDIISLHVPLVKDGPFPTAPLLGDKQLALIRPGSFLINASRGPVIEGLALLKKASELGALILDVWPEEPKINPNLLAQTQLASPHVAGYSQGAKYRGTQMIAQAFCLQFGLKIIAPSIQFAPQEINCPDNLAQLFGQISGQAKDDQNLRQGLDFKELRDHYSFRPEWNQILLKSSNNLPQKEQELAAKLGFCLL